MFCERCGTKIEDSAKFCTNCGASIAISEEKQIDKKILDTEVQLRVKSKFKFWYMILPYLSIYTIVILVFSLIMSVISIDVGCWTFLIGFSILVIVLLIKAALNKKQYDSFCYDFYKTKIAYRDSFLNLSEKEVKYKNIREVTMRQTFVQRYFNIGDIILRTSAESGYRNGINILNVENVQDVYKKVKSIIDI